MSVRWTRTALRSLDEIASFIAQRDPQEATRFARLLRDKTEALAHMPLMGRAGRLAGTRELVLHKHYLAIYRVKDEQVDILRIHHTARRL